MPHDVFTSVTEIGGVDLPAGQDSDRSEELFDRIPEQPLSYPEFTLSICHPLRPCSYILREAAYAVGRDPSNALQIVNRFVSRRHAYLVRVPTKSSRTGFTYCLIDGNRRGQSSTNGVFVNGTRVATHYLKSGDVIYFGPEIRAYFFEVARIPHVPNPFISGITEDPRRGSGSIRAESDL
ncbi:FHA domain-containing protein [Thermostichus vulcanus]|uniref:FHA domain-containing protein n=1 Tax=Thermostichus vulcanus TaxID=32053 RepID=UPI001FCBD636|nr:FHA domain-containing protein [Thermostichus vulcanus]